MTSRREFLERMGWTGMGWKILPLAGGPAAMVLAPMAPAAARPPSLHAVLVDADAWLAASGAPVRVVTNGEITQLWLREIEPAWKQQPVAIAGLTASSTLFCLEQLAWTYRMRVVFHAEHVILPEETLHSVKWRDAALAPVDASVLTAAGANWSARIGDVFASYNCNLPLTAAGPSCAGLEPLIPQGASLLTSWIIAPV